jgi:ubiquinone biosynthesis protein UbiJ
VTDGRASASTGLPLAALEIALNQLLALDPLTLERLAALDGRVIRLEVPALGLQFALAPHGSGLQWLSTAPEVIDAHISGSLADLLRAQAGGGLEGLQIEGDKHLASAFASALREARIDWPELLAPWLGDVATQRGAQALASVTGALREGADSLLRSGAEFLQYERPVLVSATEWDSFRAEIRDLHEAVGALERRIALLALRRQ